MCQHWTSGRIIAMAGRREECRKRVKIEKDSAFRIIENGFTSPVGTQLHRHMWWVLYEATDLFDYIAADNHSSLWRLSG